MPPLAPYSTGQGVTLTPCGSLSREQNMRFYLPRVQLVSHESCSHPSVNGCSAVPAFLTGRGTYTGPCYRTRTWASGEQSLLYLPQVGCHVWRLGDNFWELFSPSITWELGWSSASRLGGKHPLLRLFLCLSPIGRWYFPVHYFRNHIQN